MSVFIFEFWGNSQNVVIHDITQLRSKGGQFIDDFLSVGIASFEFGVLLSKLFKLIETLLDIIDDAVQGA
jgi:hypothetical protein